MIIKPHMISKRWNIAHLKIQMKMKHADIKQKKDSTNMMKEMKKTTTTAKPRHYKISQSGQMSQVENLNEGMSK